MSSYESMIHQCLICGGPGSSRAYNQKEMIQSSRLVVLKGEISSCRFCGEQIFLQGSLGPQLERERTSQPSLILFKMACLLHERVLKGRGADPIGFRMENGGDSTHGEYGILHDYKKWTESFPKTPLEQIDRALLNISRHLLKFNKDRFFTNSCCLQIVKEDPFSARALFCFPGQADDLVGMMDSMEYVESNVGKRSGSESLTIKLKPGGLHRLAELEASYAEKSDTCFVAMAYHKDTKDYREAVREAIESAGYDPKVITVDEKQHNDFIMDRVINMIDDAHFVIADLTVLPEGPPGKEEGGESADEKKGKVKNGVRGGVYWEAGYAKGRGKEVIYTCNSDDNISENRIHFDVEQIIRLRWKREDLDEFERTLRQRIIATVGKGPRYKE